MLGTILTPTAIWKNFTVKDNLSFNVITEEKVNGVIYTRFKLEGREVEDGKVNIYAELYRKASSKETPAVLLIEDFSIRDDKTLVKNLLKQGFSVLQIDIAGFSQGKENYTEYPASIEYANYELVKDNILHFEKSADKTCWFEWSAVIRYAIKFLKELPLITKVGVVGSGMVATALWQAVAIDYNVDCVVVALNSGWLGYRGSYKFGGGVETQLNDQLYKFIAGIDPQSYVSHLSCPTLLLSATNNQTFDCDRAYDTISRIEENIYSSVHYSQNQINKINQDAYTNMSLFLDKFLQEDAEIYLPGDCEIKCEIVDGELQICVNGDRKGLKSVTVYIAEQVENPALRSWRAVTAKKKGDGKYTTKYLPYNKSEMVVMFATLKYDSGFTTCTNIIAKKFNEEEIKVTYKNNIVFSSREESLASLFTPANTIDSKVGIELFSKSDVAKKKGPMGIIGITHESGILTFIPCRKKNHPEDNSIFMLDVYTKNPAQLVVTLTADYFGNKTEYFARVDILGGDIWHNVKIEMNKFKTAEGRVLKGYADIEAITINADDEFLINNALWI
jgi:hypothetical protein